MNATFTLRTRAERDVEERIEYLLDRNVSAAIRLREALRAAFRKIAASPYMGSAYESAAVAEHGIRYWVVPRFKNYVIYYRPTDEGVEIVRVLYGAQDAPALLAEEMP